jgi:glycine oxidase
MSGRILVAGAGAVGCLSALEFALRGWQVTLVERGAMGREASWAGGGILFPLLPWRYGESVNRLALAGAARYAELSAELVAVTGIDPQYQVCGMLALPDFGGEMALQWCRAHALAAEIRGEALWLPQVAQVRNPRLLQALRTRLKAMGVQILETTELAPLQAKDGRLASWRISDGRLLDADTFVLTAGAWSKNLLGEHALQLRHKPMRGQMLLYKLDSQVLPHILYHNDFYLIPRRDGHILAGSTVEDVGFDKSTTTDVAERLHAKAISLLPALACAQLVMHWSGLRPGSPDNVPVISRHPEFDNLYLNTGHFRYGVTMAPASAEILVRLVCGLPPPEGAFAYPYPRDDQ